MPQCEYEVRLATPEDALPIYECYDGSWSASYGIGYTPDEMRDIITAPNTVVIIAADHDTVIGLTICYDMVGWGYLDNFFVTPKYRSLGIGRSMLRFLLSVTPPKWKYVEASWLDYHTGWVFTRLGFRELEETLRWSVYRIR